MGICGSGTKKAFGKVATSSGLPGKEVGCCDFYERYGIEEYYIYDPDDHVLTGFRRGGDRFQGFRR